MIHATGHADIIEKPAAVDSEPSMPFTPRFTYRYLSAYFKAMRTDRLFATCTFISLPLMARKNSRIASFCLFSVATFASSIASAFSLCQRSIHAEASLSDATEATEAAEESEATAEANALSISLGLASTISVAFIITSATSPASLTTILLLGFVCCRNCLIPLATMLPPIYII